MANTQLLEMLLEKQLGAGTVTLHSRRGTSTAGWLTISIDRPETPDNLAKAQNIISEWNREPGLQIKLRWIGGESHE